MNSIGNQISTDIERNGYSITQGLFSEDVLDTLRTYADCGVSAGKYRDAGIGSGSRHQIQQHIRGDQIWWLDREDGSLIEPIFSQFDRLKEYLNQNLYLGLFEFECHLARYQSGSGYERHYDRPLASRRRKLTLTLYLNKGWSLNDGGHLRLYLNSGPERFIDIAPQFGTLVVFLSEVFAHEVLISNRDRYSLTGWFLERK
jgi:SM-20-related protein